MSERRLEGRVALVTGGASGIGAAGARRFAEEGARVAAFDLQKADGGDWAEAVRVADASHFEVGDVRDDERVAEAVAAIIEHLGPIDVLVNSAGVAGRERVRDAHQLGRFGKPLEIANAAPFLASDESSFVTGHALVVDGGYTAGHRFGLAKLMGLD